MSNFNWRNEMPEVPESIHAAVIDVLEEINRENVHSRTCNKRNSRTSNKTNYQANNQIKNQEKSSKKKGRMKKSLFIPLVAVLCLAIGGTVVAVNLYQQRMEAMSREMLEDFYANAYVGSVFHTNRELSEAEADRYEKLEKEYENEGRFPEGCVTYLEDYTDYRGKGIGLYAERSTLFLPDDEMSEEEMLQLIDFYHKVAYSVNTIGSEIVEEAYQYDHDYQQVAPEGNGDSVVAYEGSVGVICATEGKECLYLAGKNVIERMDFGESKSVPFYEADFGENTVVQAMEEDLEQGLYVLLLSRNASGYTGSKILHVDKDGTLLYEKEMPEVVAYDLAVDGKGRLYAETFREVYVYDEAGAEICAWEIPYSLQNGCLCRGKDGKVYTLCEEISFQTSLLCLDPDAREQVKLVAADGLPIDSPRCCNIARGVETDFVLWRDDGVYTYNLGDTFVHKVLEVYEAPLPWEDADFMMLEDGRAVFVKYFDAEFVEGEVVEILPVPESVRICYVTLSQETEDNKVLFERSHDTILGYKVEALTLFTELYYRGYGEVFRNTDTFSVEDMNGREKVIWSEGALADPMDMYLIKEKGTSGVTLWNRLLSEADWVEGVPDCACDYWIMLGDMQLGYSSESGTVTDSAAGSIFKIAEEDRELMNTVLEHYFMEDR